ncbi:hypothetical protein KEM56_001389 [Ascosphaera pollenicola]|nr:hypothetical protein KEM56_001389 [Ascosphaera pollenicola]
MAWGNVPTVLLFALNWLKGDLFTSLDDWWTGSTTNPTSKTYPNFIAEVEMMLGIQFQQNEARRELELTTQQPGELIRPYFERL